MQSENRLFDDFVKVMNGAAGTLAGMTREAQAAMQERFREWIGGLDLIKRDEFDAGKAMAVAAREENEALRARIEALEGKGTAAAKPARGREAARPAARPSTVLLAENRPFPCALPPGQAVSAERKRTGDRFMDMDEYELEREASAPIDMLETYFGALGWAYERNGEDEIVSSFQGSWTQYELRA